MIKKLEIWIIAVLSILAIALAGLGLGLFLSKKDNSNNQATVTPQQPTNPNPPSQDLPPLDPGVTYDQTSITAFKEQAADLIGFDTNYQIGSNNVTNVFNSMIDRMLEATGQAFADSAVKETNFLNMVDNLQAFIEKNPSLDFSSIFDLDHFNELNFTDKLSYALEVTQRLTQLLRKADPEADIEAGVLRQLLDVFNLAEIDYSTMGRVYYNTIINILTVVEDSRVQLNSALNELIRGYETNNETVRALLAAIMGGSVVADYVTPVKYQMLAYGEQKYATEFEQMLNTWDEYGEAQNEQVITIATAERLINQISNINMSDEQAVNELKTEIRELFTDAKNSLFSHYKTYTNVYGEQETNLLYISGSLYASLISIENKLMPILGIVSEITSHADGGSEIQTYLPPVAIVSSVSDALDSLFSLINNFTDGILNIYTLMADERFSSAVVESFGGSVQDIQQNHTLNFSTPTTMVDTIKANEGRVYLQLSHDTSSYSIIDGSSGYTLFSSSSDDISAYDANIFIRGYNFGKSEEEKLKQVKSIQDFEDLKNLNLDDPKDLTRFRLIELGILHVLNEDYSMVGGVNAFKAYQYKRVNEGIGWVVTSWNVDEDTFYETHTYIPLWSGLGEADVNIVPVIFDIFNAFFANENTKIAMSPEEYFTFDRHGFNFDVIGEIVANISQGFVQSGISNTADYIGFTATSRRDDLTGLWHADDLYSLMSYFAYPENQEQNALYTDPQTGKTYLIFGFVSDRNLAYCCEWDEANGVWKNVEYKDLTSKTFDDYIVENFDHINIHASSTYADENNRVIIDKVIPTVQLTVKDNGGSSSNHKAIKIVDKDMNPRPNMAVYNKLINYILNSSWLDKLAEINYYTALHEGGETYVSIEAAKAAAKQGFTELLASNNEEAKNNFNALSVLLAMDIAMVGAVDEYNIDITDPSFTSDIFDTLGVDYTSSVAFAPLLFSNFSSRYILSDEWMQKNGWWFYTTAAATLVVPFYVMLWMEDYNNSMTVEDFVRNLNIGESNDYLQAYVLQLLMAFDMKYNDVDYGDWELELVSIQDNKQVEGFDVIKSIEDLGNSVTNLIVDTASFGTAEVPLFDENGDIIKYDNFYNVVMPELMIVDYDMNISKTIFSENIIREINTKLAEDQKLEFTDLSIEEANRILNEFWNQIQTNTQSGEWSISSTIYSDSWMGKILQPCGFDSEQQIQSNVEFKFTDLHTGILKVYFENRYSYVDRLTLVGEFGIKGISDYNQLSNRTIVEWFETKIIEDLELRHNGVDVVMPLTLENEILAWANTNVAPYTFYFSGADVNSLGAKALLRQEQDVESYEVQQFNNITEVLAYLLVDHDLFMGALYTTIFAYGSDYISAYVPAGVRWLDDFIELVNQFFEEEYNRPGDGNTLQEAINALILGQFWFLSPQSLLNFVVDQLSNIFGDINRGAGILGVLGMLGYL